MIYLYDPDINTEDIKNVNRALNKKWLSGNSPIIKEFENKLADFLGVKYVSTCSSGTAGLHLALLGLGIKAEDEVIMPSLSYIATANSVKYVGAKPVFVDVDYQTWQLDPYKIEAKINSKTKAIMPVHLYGGVPNLNEISKIAKKFNLKIVSIEDLVAYRMKHDRLIKKKLESEIETKFGKFNLTAYEQTTNNQIHVSLTKGTWSKNDSILTRIHSSRINNDILTMLRNTQSKANCPVMSPGKAWV